MLLFYQPNLLNHSSEKFYTLNEEDSRHCIKVLRKNTKDIIHVVDGKGGLYECEITKPNDKKCEFIIVSTKADFQKRHNYLHIAITPTKNAERLEWFIEKCVEIGVDEISLILTKHSERKIQKIERLEKITISAMKQSLKTYLPTINELVDFDTFLTKTKSYTNHKLMAHLSDDAQPLVMYIKQTINIKITSFCLLIGPEGDFTKEEVIKAQNAGFQVITLGNSRLRTETAGVVACTIINLF